MKFDKPIFSFTFIIFLIISFPCFAQTSLWQISKGDNILYLGGTIHVLGEEDYPLPVEYEQAFSESQKIIFETDLGLAKEPEFAKKLMAQMLYLPGETLRDVLDDKTYKRLSDYFSDELPMAQIDVLKPGMVVIMMSAIEFQRMGMVLMGVDEHFWILAEQDGKEIGALETVDEQLSFLVNMGKGNENELILNSLDDLSKIKLTIEQIRSSWRSGDMDKMKNIILQDMIDTYPELYQSLIVTRNMNWLPYIETLINDDKTDLVLVGALHLVGNDGLLQLLRNNGYKVDYYQASKGK